MFRNYLLIAIRNLLKNPAFTLINVTGLVIGLASAMLIALWVSDELSWDNNHTNKDQIARIYFNGLGDGNEIHTQMAVCLPLWKYLEENEADIEYVSPTNWGWEITMGIDDRRINKFTYFVGPDFLKMFTFPLVKGSDDLGNPKGMIVTESAARELFGDEDPIGKTILVNNHFDMTVTGVIQDPPVNNTFQFKCLIPFETYTTYDQGIRRALTNWQDNAFNMYVQFRSGVDPLVVEERLKDVLKKHQGEGSTQELTFLPMSRWRLWDEFENGKSSVGRIVYVRSFSLIGVFVLIIACINFTNLATARSEKRAKEVGIRKSIGSRRKDLIVQFLGETVLLALVSGVIAVTVVEMILPAFNQLIEKNLSVDYSNPLLWVVLPVVVVATGVLAGVYPAFYLSAFNPARVLKGLNLSGKSGALPRKVLVTVQFFFSIALIIATVATYMQLNHMRARAIGYDKNNLLLIYTVSKNNLIKDELLRTGLAEDVATSSSPVTHMYWFRNDISWTGKREDQLNGFAVINTGYDYTKTLRAKILEGRDFDRRFNDSLSMMLNRAAVEYMGLADPIGTTVQAGNRQFTVTGVLENIVMSSPTERAQPTVFLFNPETPRELMVRLPADKPIEETIAGIQKIYRQHLPEYPFEHRFTDEVFDRRFSSIELIGTLTNLFAVLAIFISCLGLFGLAAFTAERRVKEIGIRKILGASVTSLVGLLSREFSVLVLIAFVLAGPPTIWIANDVLSRFAYHTTVSWWVAVMTGLGALMLAVITVSLHAWKAARSNPTQALRSE
jgi:putative ABC transport system permease protein